MGQITTSDKKGFISPYNNLDEELKNSTKPNNIGTFAPNMPKKPVADVAFFDNTPNNVGAAEIKTNSPVSSTILESLPPYRIARVVATEALTVSNPNILIAALHILKPEKYTKSLSMVDSREAEEVALQGKESLASETITEEALLEGTKVIELLRRSVRNDKESIRRLLNRNVTSSQVEQIKAEKVIPIKAKPISNVLRNPYGAKLYKNTTKNIEIEKTVAPQTVIIQNPIIESTPSVAEIKPFIEKVEDATVKVESEETPQIIINETKEIKESKTETHEPESEVIVPAIEIEVPKEIPVVEDVEEVSTPVEIKEVKSTSQQEEMTEHVEIPLPEQKSEPKNTLDSNPFTRRASAELAPASKQEEKLKAVTTLLELFSKSSWQKLATPDRRSFPTTIIEHPEELNTIELHRWDKTLSPEASTLRNDLITI